MRRRFYRAFTLLAILGFVSAPLRANSETLSGAIYSGAYRAFAGDSCQAGAKSSGDPACAAGLAAKAATQLTEIGQTKVYQDLAALQNERVQCGIKKQQSLMGSPAAMAAAKDRINRALPVLSGLKKQVGAIVAQWQVLRGSVPQDKISNPDPYAAKRKQLEDLNTYAKTLTADYERQLSSLLQTEDIGNREFIEDHMAGLYSGVKLLTDQDFKDLQKKVSDNLAENARDLNAGASNFSNKLRNSLADDADLIGVYLNKNPESRIGVERLQCVAHQRVAGERGVDTALTIGSFALPVGALGLARAARIAYIAKIPRAAGAFTKVGKAFGYGTIVIGSVQTATQIYERCAPKVAASVTGDGKACSVSAESILADEQETGCLTSGLWAASPILGKYAVGLLSKIQKSGGNSPQYEKDLAKFIEDHKADPRKRDLASVDRLLETDAARIRATEGILGRTKPFTKKESDGLIAAHNVGKGPTYSAQEISQKKQILADAGFGFRERTIMLHKGLAGRFAGLTDEARSAEIKAYDKTNLQGVKDWSEHYNVGAQVELLRDAPDAEKFRKSMTKALESRLDKYWRSDRAKLPNELLKGMSDDFALLGSVSRGNPKLFATARQNYIDTVKLKMRKIEKEGGDAKAWLKTELASKKTGSATGPAGEMQKFESEVLSDVSAMVEKDPKFANVVLDQTSFQKSKIDDAMTQAKADIEKAVKEGPPPPAAIADASMPGGAAPKPIAGSDFKAASFEDPKDFARRQTHAREYEAWSGGTTLTDAQSQYVTSRYKQLTDSMEYSGVERLQKLGFDTREARMLQFNQFEVGANKKYAVKPIPDDVVKKTLSNYVNEPAFKAPDGISKVDATKLMQSARVKLPDMLAETKAMASKLDYQAMAAKTPAELDLNIAARNANALYCRKIINVLMAAEPDSSNVKTWKEMMTTGPCRY
ncbi:hypothetical protein BH10BDE1_BH10BDE1_26250 [soil metagenome]